MTLHSRLPVPTQQGVSPILFLDPLNLLWSELRGSFGSFCQFLTCIDLPPDSWHRLSRPRPMSEWVGAAITAANSYCSYPLRFVATRAEFQLPATVQRTHRHLLLICSQLNLAMSRIVCLVSKLSEHVTFSHDTAWGGKPNKGSLQPICFKFNYRCCPELKMLPQKPS